MIDINDIYKKDFYFVEDFKLTPSGDISTINGIENVRLSLFRRLLTSKGTLSHRPEYGVGIKDFIGSLNSVANQQTLALRIKEEFESDERVEKVNSIGIRNNKSDQSLVEISVNVKIVGFGENRMTFLPFGDGV